jgi:hypothetical protein
MAAMQTHVLLWAPDGRQHLSGVCVNNYSTVPCRDEFVVAFYAVQIVARLEYSGAHFVFGFQ